MSRDAELLADALDLPPADRGGFLDRECCGNVELRARVEALIAGAGKVGDFLEPSAGNLRAGLEKPGDVIGRYTLRERIGEGGCGTVWRARQREPVQRDVALKVIKLGMDTREVVTRFEAERQALALMDHPNIAQVFDGGATETGRPFFVMELVRGVPITRYCDEANLPPMGRLELFIDVCHAVQHAHQKGIIHRDLKPSNILVTVHDDVAVPKVIDFGIAKATQGRLTDETVFTAFEQFIGTPAYMSPEQAAFNALDVDTRSDVYSLGVLLYELLTGQPPFDPKSLVAGGLEEIRRVIREVDPPRPSTCLNTLGQDERVTRAQRRGIAPAQLSILVEGDLDWIVMRCLEKSRARRYETANGLAMDLQRHLRHEPVAARPPSRAYLMRKFVRRHRIGVGGAAAMGSMLLLGATVSLWQANRAKRAEHEQSRLREAAQAAQVAERSLRQEAEAEKLAARRRAYTSDMIALQEVLGLDSLGGARQLLDRQRPKPGEADLRNWEWRYLWQFAQSDAQSTLATSSDFFDFVATSPDGKWLAAGTGGAVALWNRATGARNEISPAHFGINRACFSPGGPVLALAGRSAPGSGAKTCRVILWDLTTQRELRALSLNASGDWCAGLFFARDGNTLVTACDGEEPEIAVWSVATGGKLSSFRPQPPIREQRYSPFAVSADLELAAYVTRDDFHVHVVDLAAGKELWDAKGGAERAIALCFSPDGTMLASGEGFQESAIFLWHARTGARLGRLEGNRRGITQLVFWPDGKTLASSGIDQTVRIWEVESRRLTRTLRGHGSEVYSLALLPDGRTLVSGGKDGQLLEWDSAPPAQAPEFSIPGQVAAWCFTPDGGIVCANYDGRITRRDGRKFERERTVLELEVAGLSRLRSPDMAARGLALSGYAAGAEGSIIFASDAPRLARVDPHGSVEVWDWERGIRLSVVQPSQKEEKLAPLSFAGQGERLLLSRFLAQRHFRRVEWDIASGRPLRWWRAGIPEFGGAGPFVVRSPDEQTLISVSKNSVARLDLPDGKHSGLPLNLQNSQTLGAFSPDGTLFVVPSMSGHIHVIGVDPLRSVASFPNFLKSAVHAAAFSADGSRLVTGSGGREAITFWEVGTYDRVLMLRAPWSMYRQLAFSPDGRTLGALGGILPQTELRFWRAPSWEEIAAAESKADAARQVR